MNTSNGEKIDNCSELTEAQVSDIYGAQGIRDLTMKELWGDDVKVMFFGKDSDRNLMNSLFGPTIYEFISCTNSIDFIKFFVETFKKIQEISANSKIKKDFENEISKVLDSDVISLIFQEIKVIPVEKDTETPILSQKKFQEILEKLLPKIMEKCKNRENHKLEAFAAIAARIIWYLVILAVEFTRATWQKEPEEVQDSEDREEQNKIVTPSPKFVPFAVRKPLILIGNGLENESEVSENQKKEKSKADSQDSDSSANIPLPPKSKSSDKAVISDKEMIRKQREEEEKAEELERKKLLEELKRKREEDRKKDRVGLMELDQMTKSQRKREKKEKERKRMMEREQEDPKRQKGPIDFTKDQKEDQKDPEAPKRQKKPWKRWDVPLPTSDPKDQKDQDQNQVVSIECVEKEKLRKTRNIDSSRKSIIEPKKPAKPIDNSNFPEAFRIYRARFNVASFWPFISVRSVNSEICSSMSPEILKNRRIFGIFRILIVKINSNAGIFRDEILRNQKEPLTMEQLIGIMEEMCEKVLEGTTMYTNGMMYPLAELFTHQSVTIDFQNLSDFGRHLLSFFYEQCSDVKINNFEFNACFEFLVTHIYKIAVDIVPYLVNPVADSNGLYHIRPNLTAHTRQTFSDLITPLELLGRLCRLHTLTHSLLFRSPNSSTLWTSVPLEHDPDRLLELLLEPGLAQALPGVVRNFLTVWMYGVQERMKELANGKLQKICQDVFKKSEFKEVVTRDIARNCSRLVHRVLSEVLNCPKRANFRVFDGPWADFIDNAIKEPWHLLDKCTFTNSTFEDLCEKQCSCSSYLSSLFPGRSPIKYLRKHTLLQFLRFAITLGFQTIRHVATVTKTGPSEFSIKFSTSFETSSGVEGEEMEQEQEPEEQRVVKKRKEEQKKSLFIPPPSCTPPMPLVAPDQPRSISIPLSPNPRSRTISSSSSAHQQPENVLEGVPEQWKMAYSQVLSFNEELQKELEIKKQINNVLKEFRRRK